MVYLSNSFISEIWISPILDTKYVKNHPHQWSLFINPKVPYEPNAKTNLHIIAPCLTLISYEKPISNPTPTI